MRHRDFWNDGIGSWPATQCVASEHGIDNMVLLFADTLLEDPDLHQFAAAARRRRPYHKVLPPHLRKDARLSALRCET